MFQRSCSWCGGGDGDDVGGDDGDDGADGNDSGDDGGGDGDDVGVDRRNKLLPTLVCPNVPTLRLVVLFQMFPMLPLMAFSMSPCTLLQVFLLQCHHSVAGQGFVQAFNVQCCRWRKKSWKVSRASPSSVPQATLLFPR